MWLNKPFRNFALLLLLGVWSCSSTVKIDGLDTNQWKGDKYGCKGMRTEFTKLIRANRNTLLELGQKDIESLLGPPDEHELDERSRKFFYYYLEPGTNHCENGSNYPVRLQIRFNAVGLSSEVLLENYQ